MDPTREQLAELVRWATRIALVVVKLRRHLHRKGDAVESAMHALHSALRTFKPAKVDPEQAPEEAFKAFAKVRIRGEVRDAIKQDRKRARREVPYDDEVMPLSEEVLRDPDALARAAGVERFVVREAAEDPRGDPEARLLLRERVTLFEHALARCSPDEQRLYDLRHREGLPWKEVASALGLPVRTAQDHDQKLQKRLRDAMLARDAEKPRRGGAVRART
jgi:RNA polymerase sigma factor (sigma-70 family)